MFQLPISNYLSCHFLDVTSYINGEQGSHVSGDAKWCYFKYIVIIKQSCRSLHPSIFHPLFRLLQPLPPTEEKTGIASALLLNLNWTITWASVGVQGMTGHLVQIPKRRPQHWLKEMSWSGNPSILSLELCRGNHGWRCSSWLETLDSDSRKLTLEVGATIFNSCASHSAEQIDSILSTYLFNRKLSY